jgi:hypothetical protein
MIWGLLSSIFNVFLVYFFHTKSLYLFQSTFNKSFHYCPLKFVNTTYNNHISKHIKYSCLPSILLSAICNAKPENRIPRRSPQYFSRSQQLLLLFYSPP